MFTWYTYILRQFFEGFELVSGPFWVNSLFSHHFSDQQVTWVLISPLTLIWFHKLAEWILCKQEHNWDKKNKLLLSGLCSSSCFFFFLAYCPTFASSFFHQEFCVIYLLLLYTLLTILSVQLFWSLCFIPICFI
jgi:cobalamin biosynthesis protein CobD/CbiB